MAHFLVTGANGQLGYDLARHCRASGDEVTATGRADLDIADADAVASLIDSARPDIIVNCAAWTDVDGCESDPGRAMRDNADAVAGLRTAADAVGAHLVQISTDYVFDGTLDRPYVETDEPNPLSVYGSSKLAGEQAAGQSATIIRTSWVCGVAGDNMVKTVLRLVVSAPVLRFVDDQFGKPSFTTDLAPRVRDLALARAPGVHHLTNDTYDATGVSWFEFVRTIVEVVGRDPAMVEPIATAELQPPRPAPRPANGALANTTTEPLRHYREPLQELIAALIDMR